MKISLSPFSQWHWGSVFIGDLLWVLLSNSLSFSLPSLSMTRISTPPQNPWSVSTQTTIPYLLPSVMWPLLSLSCAVCSFNLQTYFWVFNMIRYLSSCVQGKNKPGILLQLCQLSSSLLTLFFFYFSFMYLVVRHLGSTFLANFTYTISLPPCKQILPSGLLLCCWKIDNCCFNFYTPNLIIQAKRERLIPLYQW